MTPTGRELRADLIKAAQEIDEVSVVLRKNAEYAKAPHDAARADWLMKISNKLRAEADRVEQFVPSASAALACGCKGGGVEAAIAVKLAFEASEFAARSAGASKEVLDALLSVQHSSIDGILRMLR